MVDWNPNNFVQSRTALASQIRLATKHFVDRTSEHDNAMCSVQLTQDSFMRKLHMSMQSNSSNLLASIDETGDIAGLEPGNQLNQQITDLVDAIFRISLGQKPHSDDFYISLMAAAGDDDEAINKIPQKLESDFHIIEKAYLLLAESVQDENLDLITKAGRVYANLGSINGIRLLVNCQEVELLAFLDPDADLVLDDPQIAIVNHQDGTQSMMRFLSNETVLTLRMH